MTLLKIINLFKMTKLCVALRCPSSSHSVVVSSENAHKKLVNSKVISVTTFTFLERDLFDLELGGRLLDSVTLIRLLLFFSIILLLLLSIAMWLLDAGP